MEIPAGQSSSNLISPEGSLVEVSGLGVFRMKDIHDALSSTEKQPIDIATIKNSRSTTCIASPEDSDCSWTHEEEDGRFYFDINRRISNFAASDESNMSLPMLSRSQRRFVHATAQIMHLGHASLGPQGRQRSMLLFKYDNNYLVSRTDRGMRPPASPSVVSSITRDYPRKRRRLPRVPGGFPCQFSDCTRVFDRASERKKHEQSHQPAYTNQFQCATCNKGFRYKKDLARHFRVHNSDSGLGESFGSSQATSSILTSDSRVPSDTSLFLGWNAGTSRAGSPVLRRRDQDQEDEAQGSFAMPQAGIDFELFAPPQGELFMSSLHDLQNWPDLGVRTDAIATAAAAVEAASSSCGDRWDQDVLENTASKI